MTPRASQAPKLWPAVPVSFTWMVSSGRPVVAVALGDLAREHGAGGAVGVPDRRHDPHRRAALERGLRLRDQPAVEDRVDLVVLRLAIVDARRPGGASGLIEQLGEVEALGLPVLDHLAACRASASARSSRRRCG